MEILVSPLIGDTQPGPSEVDVLTEPVATSQVPRPREGKRAQALTILGVSNCFDFGACRLGETVSKKVMFRNINDEAVAWELHRKVSELKTV